MGDKVLNIIAWSDNEQNALNLIKKLASSQTGESQWTVQFEDYQLKVFLRFPHQSQKVTPVGWTDLIVLSVDETNEGLALEYLDTRKGIPLKFLTGKSSDQELADDLGCELLKEQDFKADLIYRAVVDYDKALRDTFNKIDTNSNGLLDQEEIIMVSKELNHDLSASDANEIILSMGNQGKIDYAQFKHWWVLGRADFTTFRQVIGMKLKLNDLIERNKDYFTKYIEELNELEEEPTGEKMKCKYSIVPELEDDRLMHPTAFNVHLSIGAEYEDLIKNFPLYYTDPMTIGLELTLKSNQNEENSKLVIETFEIVKNMLKQMNILPKLQEQGIMLKARTQGDSVFIETSLGGSVGEFVSSKARILKFDKLNFSGKKDLHISTKFPVEMLFKVGDLGDMLAHLTKANFELNFEGTNIVRVLDYLVLGIKNMFGDDMPNSLAPWIFTYKVISAIRKFDFTFNYDPKILTELIKSLVGDFPFVNANFRNFHAKTLEEELPGITQAVKMMLAPFLPALKVINLEKINLIASTPLAKLFLKVGVNMSGLNDIVEKLLLQ